jgi:hypothetical protein
MFLLVFSYCKFTAFSLFGSGLSRLGLFIYLRLVLIPKIRISEDKLEIATSHFRTKTLLPNEIVNIDYNENEIIITTTNNNNIKISKNEIELANFETLTQDLSNFKMV